MQQEKNSYWCCMNCVQQFSFHTISDEEFSSILSGVDANKSLLRNCISKSKLLSSYEYKYSDFENYIDPGNNLHNDIYVYINSRYYNYNKFKPKYKTSKSFSSIHFNCRNLLPNIYKILFISIIYKIFILIKEQLHCLSLNFDAIA